MWFESAEQGEGCINFLTEFMDDLSDEQSEIIFKIVLKMRDEVVKHKKLEEIIFIWGKYF